jgi:predicted MFS family arabinose efflux permease
MVSLMRDKGFDLAAAAAIASATGLASFLSRLGTDLLLDRLPTRLIGACAFLLPVVVALMLLNAGNSLALCIVAAILFGFASGAETDVITYIIARAMPEIFGTAYAVSISIITACASARRCSPGRSTRWWVLRSL